VDQRMDVSHQSVVLDVSQQNAQGVNQQND
jgi:hypothetical protein